MQEQVIVLEQSSDLSKFKFYFNDGQNQYLLKDYLKSIEAYTVALKINPNSMACYLSRAAGYQALGRFSEAENDRKMAKELRAKTSTNLGKRTSAQINLQLIRTSKKPSYKTNWQLGKISKQNKKSKTDNKKTQTETSSWMNGAFNDVGNESELGRWEINRSSENIKECWQKVEQALEQGYLWHAKLSTKRESNGRIMIYTKDHHQLDDIIATFNYLKMSGICKPDEVIYYKDNINEPYLYSSEAISWAQANLQVSETLEPSASVIGNSLTKAIKEDLPSTERVTVDLTTG